MGSVAFDRVCTAFRDNGLMVIEKSGDRADAQAPGHSPADRSVSIRSIEDRVLVNCHAGEQLDEVLTAIGLQMRDLFDSPKGSTYRYPDGRQVHRTPDKKFFQKGNTRGRSLFRADRIVDADTVFVVEGEQDVLAIESVGGVATCSAMGAGKAHLFDWTPLRGKNVVVVADRDQPGRKHAHDVVERLRSIANSVRLVESAVGKDAADHIMAGKSLEDFELVADDDEVDPPVELCHAVTQSPVGEKPVGRDRLVQRVEQPRRETNQTERPIYPSPGAPLDVARKLFADYRRADGLRTLRAWRGGWMRWAGSHWFDLDPAQLRSEIYDRLGEVDYMRPVREKGVVVDYERTPWDPNKRKIADVMEAMAAVGHLSTDIDPPTWIELHDLETSAAQVVSCQNGLLDLSTRTVSEHTPALFNVVSVPFCYDRHVGAPTAWLKFLKSVWPNDPDSIALLQEYIGYVLSGRTDMQKMLLLIGPTRSGKGTIARMLAMLIGRGHVSGPTLASLGTNFGMSPLLGKPLAIISDARLGSTPAHTIVERLLSITGEDMLTVDRKFREPWSGKLPTRFVILSNELPRFKDASGAIANRLLILQMTNSFLGREDRGLDRRLEDELPAILSWALDGLDRLTRNGKFTVPGSSDAAANLMMDMASPMSAFVRECCVREPSAEVERDVLYAAWKAWCEDNGHICGAKSSFGRDLRAVVPDLADKQPRINGVQVRHYGRIRLRSKTDNAEPPDSPVSHTESAGHSVVADAGHPVSGEVVEQPTLTDAGQPVSEGAIKQQVNGADTGDAGATPFKPQHENHRCRFCNGELKYTSARSRGYCSSGACLIKARQQNPAGAR
ncbi:phage/plasmid primase, P4 family [Mycolicibacterium iranicum]|uniref:Phage/plasmid primase, P4 family n=1 Tax=Mycolicibacterium iranicum TaxID=912594 RepID=A0ABT4HAF6_MYCIR|nr:phage/plasmid primase, P4 family [Mycolicibacterium iranicum]MCZ0727193.1 phage/plasmid primase, P4 family [Mycolicibacterium iranicum]